jgi:transposase
MIRGRRSAPKALGGQSDHTGRISRMGDETVRTSLYEAASALIAVSKSKCALRMWALKLRKEKGFRKATVACARKLAVIMHRMWIAERNFDATPVA